jgi:hypothetical protein
MRTTTNSAPEQQPDAATSKQQSNFESVGQIIARIFKNNDVAAWRLMRGKRVVLFPVRNGLTPR